MQLNIKARALSALRKDKPRVRGGVNMDDINALLNGTHTANNANTLAINLTVQRRGANGRFIAGPGTATAANGAMIMVEQTVDGWARTFEQQMLEYERALDQQLEAVEHHAQQLEEAMLDDALTVLDDSPVDWLLSPIADHANEIVRVVFMISVLLIMGGLAKFAYEKFKDATPLRPAQTQKGITPGRVGAHEGGGAENGTAAPGGVQIH